MRHLSQERFSKRLERSQFISQGGVEHHVRILLEWKDMLLLPAPHRFPAADSLRSSVATLTRVAHNTAEEPRVSRGNTVVTIQVQLSQGRDVNPKGFTTSICGDEPRVQPVNPLQDDGLSGLQTDLFPRFS